MPSARDIKNRIRSVKNIGQITRALEAVSASRVRRAQIRVMASRAYAEKAWEILLNVQSAGQAGAPMHPLLTQRTDVKKIMIVLITSEIGQAGAFNSNIIRVAQRFAERQRADVEWVTIARKGRDALIRARQNIVASFNLPSEPTTVDLAPIARLAIDAFLSGQVDDVYIAYTDFINTLTQRPVVVGWLPLIPRDLDKMIGGEFLKEMPAVTANRQDYEYEPSPVAILDEIVPRFTELQLYQAVLESLASEHSARMVAMRNATDNANQLAAAYTLVYNKARQTAITNEILDIVGGAEALQASIDKTTDEVLSRFQHEMLIDKKATVGARQRPNARVQGPSGGVQPQASAASTPTGGAAVMELEAEAPATQADGSPEDDLTVIEGIGRKMSSALKEAGLRTYADVAGASDDQLRSAIEAAGMRFSPSLPTWAEQAGYAARGDWDGLEQFKATLTSGRRTE
jgi:F-type H+-transporting ATPase subunit gamma